MKSTGTGLIFDATARGAKQEALLYLMPLVETAWAHGAISPRERRIIFEAARAEAIDERDERNETLDELLRYQPSREFFDECLRSIEESLRAMTVKERRARHAQLIERCRAVAAAAGGKSPMDLDHHVSVEEQALLDRYRALLD